MHLPRAGKLSFLMCHELQEKGNDKNPFVDKGLGRGTGRASIANGKRIITDRRTQASAEQKNLAR